MSDLYFPSPSTENTATDQGPANRAELQGALCGLLCLNPRTNRNHWYQDLYQQAVANERENEQLTTLFDDTLQSLDSLEFHFTLALPDDDVALSSRIIAMTDWCHGLMYGLSIAGLSDEIELSKDSQGFISDLVKISQADHQLVTEENEDENDFAELCEYLRMGLFVLYNELQPNTATA